MKTTTVQSAVFCIHDDKYVHDYSHGNNLHAMKTWSECMHMHAWKTCKQWSKYNFTCVLQFAMKTTTVQSTVFCTHDDKYVHDYSHGNNLHAMKTWSECMHMHVRKTSKQWSKYNFTCVLQFVMKTTTVQSTVFCTHDDKQVHDYSHGNNLHAMKTWSECTENIQTMVNVYNCRCALQFVMKTTTVQSTVFCAHDDKYVHDYSHRNNLHAMKTWSECMHAWKTCKQWSKYNFTCVLQFVMKTNTVQSTVFCTHDDKYVHVYSHGNNLHALKTWSGCMHMHAWKTCKQWSKYKFTCVLQFLMKKTTVQSTVFCTHDDKYVHDYSHGNNLHAMKTWSEFMHMYARITCKQW